MGNLTAAQAVVVSVSLWQRSSVGIGQRIRVVREAFGVGLRELASKVKLPSSDKAFTPGALSKIETEMTEQPSFETVAAIADALSVSIDVLRKGDDAEAPVTHVMLSEYAKSRFRAWRREGVKLAEMARRCTLDPSLLRRVWGGGKLENVVVMSGLLKGFRLETPEQFEAAARDWWRSTGRELYVLTKPIDDPVAARAEANAFAATLGATQEDILSALEMNPNRDVEGYEFWRDEFLTARRDRLEAEKADNAQIAELQQASKRKDPAADEAAQKLKRARAEREPAETPQPKSSRAQAAPKSVRGRRAKMG